MTSSTFTQSRNLLIAKARGTIAGLTEMDERSRPWTLSGGAGRDYNDARSRTAALSPHVAEYLPPEADIERGGDEQLWTKTTPDELLTYWHQLLEILQAIADPGIQD